MDKSKRKCGIMGASAPDVHTGRAPTGVWIDRYLLSDVEDLLEAAHKLSQLVEGEDFKHQQMSVESINRALGWASPSGDYKYIRDQVAVLLDYRYIRDQVAALLRD